MCNLEVLTEKSPSETGMKPALKGLIILAIVGLIMVAAMGYGSEGFADTPIGKTNDRGTFTMYYADWCPHCKSVKPAFAEWAKNGFINVGGKNVAVSMVQPEKEPEKAKGKTIKGYPTFILETADGKTFEYEGERTPAGYQKFLEEKFKV